jgi:two-component system sensor histidine kinase/response regulator
MTHSLDLSVLEDLANHDAAKVRKYALLFVSSLEEVLLHIDGGIARDDIALLGAMGHRAKSTARNIGASDLADQCLRLENAAKANDLVAAVALAQSLRVLFVPIRAELLSYLNG